MRIEIPHVEVLHSRLTSLRKACAGASEKGEVCGCDDEQEYEQQGDNQCISFPNYIFGSNSVLMPKPLDVARLRMNTNGVSYKAAVTIYTDKQGVFENLSYKMRKSFDEENGDLVWRPARRDGAGYVLIRFQERSSKESRTGYPLIVVDDFSVRDEYDHNKLVFGRAIVLGGSGAEPRDTSESEEVFIRHMTSLEQTANACINACYEGVVGEHSGQNFDNLVLALDCLI